MNESPFTDGTGGPTTTDTPPARFFHNGTGEVPERRCSGCGAFLNARQYDLCSRCERDERETNRMREW